MAISAAALAAISAGISSATAVGGTYLQAGMNKKQMRYARELADRGLTQSDLQAFELNQQAAQETRDWQLELDSTNYQRKVADMQAAGVNPALAIGGVQSAPSSNVTAQASSAGYGQGLPVSAPDFGGSIDSLLKAKQLDMNYELQNRALDIQEKDVERKMKETDSVIQLNLSKKENQDIINSYEPERQRLQNEGQEAVNDLTRRKAKQVDEEIDKIRQDIKESIAREQNEYKKGLLIMAQEFLAKTQAEDIIAMRPFRQELMRAQTDAEKGRAALAFAQYAMQQGLIDGGAIEMQLKQLAADSGKSVNEAELKDYITAVKTGNWSKVNPSAGPVENYFMSGLFRLLTGINAELPALVSLK